MTTIQTISLGDNLHVSQIGFGGMALSNIYGSISTEEAERTLSAVIDLGVTFIDTADVYGEPQPGTTGPAGTNEEMVGRVIRGRRDEIQLATKFGITGAIGRDNEGGWRTRGDRDYVRKSCEDSLRRLNVDFIDLYYMHRRELSRPIEETVAAMAELVQEGKVRHLGLSEVTADELRAAVSVYPITAVQSEWSIWSRDVERYVVPAAAELGVGFVPYSPLGRGFLTGKFTKEATKRIFSGQPRFDQHFDENQAVLAIINRVAEQTQTTKAQVALAWLFAQSKRFNLPVVPIPGTRRVDRMEENAGALDLTLSDAQLAELDAASEAVVGDRNLTFNGPEWISSGRE